MKAKIHKYFNLYAIISVTIVIIYELFSKYRGNSASYYTDINVGALFNSNYSRDIYINEEFLKTLPIYHLFENINLNNDIIGIIIILFLSVISIKYLYKSIKLYSNLNTSKSILILIPIVALNFSPIEMTQISPIYFSLKPTILSHTLLFILLYHILKQNYIVSYLISAILFLLNVKLAWAPFLFLNLIIFFDKNSIRDRKYYFFYSVVISLLIYMFVLPKNTGMDYYSTSQIIVNRNGNEDLLSLQPFYKVFSMFLFIFSSIFYKRKKQICGSLEKSLLDLTFIFLTIYIYQILLFDYFPIPHLSLISIVRNCNILIIISIFILIDKKVENKNVLFFNTCFVTFIMIVASKLSIVYIVASIILLYSSYKTFSISEKKLTLFASFVFTLFIFTSIKSSSSILSKSMIKFNGYYNWTNNFLANNDINIINKLENKIPEDYIFLHLEQSKRKKISSINGKLNSHLSDFSGLIPNIKTNSLINRSKYIGDFAHFYFKPKLYAEHSLRINQINKLSNILIQKNNINNINLSKIFQEKKIAILFENLNDNINTEKGTCEVLSNTLTLCLIN